MSTPAATPETGNTPPLVCDTLISWKEGNVVKDPFSNEAHKVLINNISEVWRPRTRSNSLRNQFHSKLVSNDFNFKKGKYKDQLETSSVGGDISAEDFSPRLTPMNVQNRRMRSSTPRNTTILSLEHLKIKEEAEKKALEDSEKIAERLEENAKFDAFVPPLPKTNAKKSHSRSSSSFSLSSSKSSSSLQSESDLSHSGSEWSQLSTDKEESESDSEEDLNSFSPVVSDAQRILIQQFSEETGGPPTSTASPLSPLLQNFVSDSLQSIAEDTTTKGETFHERNEERDERKETVERDEKERDEAKETAERSEKNTSNNLQRSLESKSPQRNTNSSKEGKKTSPLKPSTATPKRTLSQKTSQLRVTTKRSSSSPSLRKTPTSNRAEKVVELQKPKPSPSPSVERPTQRAEKHSNSPKVVTPTRRTPVRRGPPPPSLDKEGLKEAQKRIEERSQERARMREEIQRRKALKAAQQKQILTAPPKEFRIPKDSYSKKWKSINSETIKKKLQSQEELSTTRKELHEIVEAVKVKESVSLRNASEEVATKRIERLKVQDETKAELSQFRSLVHSSPLQNLKK